MHVVVGELSSVIVNVKVVVEQADTLGVGWGLREINCMNESAERKV